MESFVERLQPRINLAVITGTAFRDANYDNVRQPSEAAAANLTAYVDLDHDGELSAGDPRAIADENGAFAIDFTPPADGTYPVAVADPNGYAYTRYVGPNNVLSVPVTVTRDAGGNAGAIGVFNASYVNAVLFNDENANGTYEPDAGDSIAQNARLYLDANNNGQLDAGEQSKAPRLNGSVGYNYALVYFKPGTVTVRASFPSYFNASTSYGGGLTQTFGNGTGLQYAYFGAYAPTVITGRAFVDGDRDGVYTPPTYYGDTASPDQPIQSRLVYSDQNANDQFDAGEPLAYTTYDGSFRLAVPVGTHTVTQVATDSLLAPNPQSFFVNATGPGRFVAGSFITQPYNTLVRGSVFEDKNGNGVRDAGETTPPPGVTDLIAFIDYDNDGRPNAPLEPSAKVAADGTYAIDHVTATGTLRLFGVSVTGGLYPTTASALTGTRVAFVPGTVYDAPAFGVQPRSRITGHVVRDTNNSGTRDASDTYGSGDIVYVDDNNNGRFDYDEPTTTTDTAGNWAFVLPSGPHTFRQQLPAGTRQTGLPETSGQTVTVLSDGAPITVPDFLRYTPPPQFTAVLSGVAFNDANNNGVFDANESYTGNLGYNLAAYLDVDNNGFRGDTEPVALVSNAGEYTFSNVKPGTYSIGFITQSPTVLVLLQTTPRTIATAVDGQTTKVPTVGLRSLPAYPVSVIAFNDLNADGVYSTGESFIVGRTIYADLNNNNQFDPLEPAVNGPGGIATLYLPIGTFTLRQVLPNGIVQTGRYVQSPSAGNTFIADGRVRVTEDAADGRFYFGSRPGWLSASSDAVYQINGSTISVSAGTVTFNADAATSYPDVTLVVSNDARLVLAAGQHLARLTLNNNATVTVAPGGDKVLRVKALTLAATATLDLNDNTFVYDYTTASGQGELIRTLLASGRVGGTWAGPGLTSGTAATHANTTLGFIEAVDYKALAAANVTVGGEAIDNTAILLKYTISGDADFDRRTDFNDFLRLQNGFGTAGGYTQGDFDFNGTVDFNDFLILQNSFGQSLTPAVTPAAVPAKAVAPASPPAPAKTAAIRGTAFVDHNHNGRYDRGDGSARGVRVFFDADNDGVLDPDERSVLTDAKGNYVFTGLAAGTYRVRQVLPPGRTRSTAVANVTVATGKTKRDVLLGSRSA